MANRAGQQLGNYRFVRRLGYGASADVYLGEHLYLKSYAALKVLHTILKEEDVERFLSEAQTLVGLRHPNIVRVLEFIFEQDTPMLVIDYAPGGTARQRYPRGSRLPLATTVAYVRQVADALQYAHNHSIIHRDVKPDNILFDSDQHILLGDFGLALLTPSHERLSTQEFAGTIPYMAPEQLQGQPVFATDQYALGIVTYEWLCGAYPFEGLPLAMINQHINAPPPSLRIKRPDLPVAVENVVLKALAKDPKQRYSSIQAFAGALARASQQDAVTLDDATQPLTALTSFAPPSSITDTTLTQHGPHKPRHIFLTAAPADEAFAARLRADLEARGVVVFSAPEAGATDQEMVLREALGDAHMILVVVSPHTRSSRAVKEQLRIASMYQQRMVFVRAAGDDIAAELPEAWGRTAMIDLIDARGVRYTTAINEMMAFFKELMPITTPEVPTLPFSPGEPRNPFKGLHAFTEGDAVDFFGRDTLILELAEAIEGMLAAEQSAAPAARLLTVIGPSGSGKSSAVRAGLLPELRKSALPGSEQWVYLEPIVPGQRPLESLVLALAPRLPKRSLHSIRRDLDDDSARGLHLLATQLINEPGTRVVLTIDQFEEVFAQAISEQERQRFIDLLVTAASEPRGPLIIVLTMRADFYDRPMQYPQLSDLIEAHQASVRPMNPHELRAVIERPAVLPDVQVIFDDNLVGDLLFESQGQIGALPLLEFTLDQLFRQREDHRLTRHAYRQIGGVKGALAKHAEATYASLRSEEHRRLAQALFLRLIDPGINEQDTTRRRAPLSELSLPDQQQTALLREVTDVFVAARLLTTNEHAGITSIEVSHEALIREWARLAEWLRETREDIVVQQIVSADAMEWVRRGKPEDRLYRGTQLVEAQIWAERNVPNTEEVGFLQAATEARGQQEQAELHQKIKELHLQRRVVSRQRLLVAALSIFSVIVIVFASLVVVSRQQADEQRQLAIEQRNVAQLQTQISLSRALAANAANLLSQNKLDQALLLSVEAYKTYNTYEARTSLLDALQQSPQIVAMLRSGSQDYVNMLAFSSDGQTFVASDTHTVYVWNTNMRSSPIRHIDIQGYIGGVALSPDNRTLAISNAAGVWLWDIQTGARLAQLNGSIKNTPPTLEPRTVITFSSGGQRVESARCAQYSTDSQGAPLCIATQISAWDVASRQLSASPLLVPANSENSWFSPDGLLLASSSDMGIQLWKAATGQPLGSPLTGLSQPITSIAFSPDDSVVAAGGGAGAATSIQLWNVPTGKPHGPPLSGHGASIKSLAFSPNGQKLASSSLDKTVRVWDVATSTNDLVLTGDAEPKWSVSFGPDGASLLSGSLDGTILLWNTQAQSALSRQLATTSLLRSPIFSSDGTLVYTGSQDGKIIPLSVQTGQALTPLDTASYPGIQPKYQVGDDPRTIESLALSKDGSILAAGRLDGTVVLWNTRTGKPFAHVVQPDLLYQIMLSADGHVLATASTGTRITITLWNVSQATALRTFSYHEDQPLSALPVALSADGKLMAVGGCQSTNSNSACNPGQIQLLNVATGKLVGQMTDVQQSTVLALAFSPDSKVLASSDPASITLWNASTRKAIATLALPPDATDYYSNLVFSPDGKTLASYGSTPSFNFVLWDVNGHQALSQGMYQNDAVVGGVTFSPDGKQLATVAGLQATSQKSVFRLWDISPNAWLHLACSIANRNLLPDEWHQFLPDQKYSSICPNLP